MLTTETIPSVDRDARGQRCYSVLFWNVKKKDLTAHVCALARDTGADALVLLESGISEKHTLDVLQKDVCSDFYVPYPAASQRFHCFCRAPSLDMSEVHSGRRVSVRKFRIGAHTLLMVLVHGLDPRNHDEATRQASIHALMKDLELVRSQQHNEKIVLLGDFNMNPYDHGMNLASGLNAMMTKDCIKRKTRTFQGNPYDFYYNPMWSHFGDATPGPAGTIYNLSSQGAYGWSMFDQVILHHSIVDYFRDVKILTSAESHSLMDSSGRPDSENISDHFPIFVRFFGRTP